MGSFSVHLTGGVAVACGVTVIGMHVGLDVVQALAAGVVCIVGAVIPDVDSDTGKSLRLVVQAVSVLVTVIMYNHFSRKISNHPEYLIVLFPAIYLFMAYPVASIIKRMTVHRGIWHSLPMGLLCGLLMAVGFADSGMYFSLCLGVSVFIGFVTHLILDEIYSLTWKSGWIPGVKKSFGTAMKFYSSIGVTLCVYFLCAIAGGYIFYSIRNI